MDLEEQNNELEVLKSIYGEDVHEIQTQQQGNLVYEIHFSKPSSMPSAPQEKIILLVNCPPNYPSESVANFSLQYFNEEFEDADYEKMTSVNASSSVQNTLSAIEKELFEVSEQNKGSVLVFLWMQSISNYFEEHPTPIFQEEEKEIKSPISKEARVYVISGNRSQSFSFDEIQKQKSVEKKQKDKQISVALGLNGDLREQKPIQRSNFEKYEKSFVDNSVKISTDKSIDYFGFQPTTKLDHELQFKNSTRCMSSASDQGSHVFLYGGFELGAKTSKETTNSKIAKENLGNKPKEKPFKSDEEELILSGMIYCLRYTEDKVYKAMFYNSSSPGARALATLNAMKHGSGDLLFIYGGISNSNHLMSDIYIGYAQYSDYSSTDSFYVYSYACHFSDPNHVNIPICGHCSTINYESNCFYSFGGVTKNDIYTNRLVSFSLNGIKQHFDVIWRDEMPRNQSKNSIPCPRAGASIISFGKHIYIFGGHTENGTVLDDLYVFDSIQCFFSKITIFGPSPCITHGSFFSLHRTDTVQNCISLIGGFNGKRWTTAVFDLDLDAKTWRMHSAENESLVNTNIAFPTIIPLSYDSIAIIGGLETTKQQKNFFKSYTSALHFIWYEKPTLCKPSVQYLKTKTDGFDTAFFSNIVPNLEKTTYKWFQSLKPLECDLEFVFLDSQNNIVDRVFAIKAIVQHIPALLKLIKQQAVRESISKDILDFQLDEIKEHVFSREAKQIDLERFLPRSQVILTQGKKFDLYVEPKVFRKVLEFAQCGMLVFDERYSEQTVQELYDAACLLDYAPLKELCLGKFTFESIQKSSLFKTYFAIGTQMMETVQECHFEQNQRRIPLGMVELVAKESLEVTEECNYYSILIHKGMLIHRSDYFKSMLDSHFMESESNQITIEELSIKGCKALVCYIYCGYFPKIEVDICVELYMAMHQFVMQEATPLLRRVIKENIDSIPVAIQVLQVAQLLSDDSLKKYCLQYLTRCMDTSQEIIQDSLQQEPVLFRELMETFYYTNAKRKRRK